MQATLGTVDPFARDCFGGGCRHTPRNDVGGGMALPSGDRGAVRSRLLQWSFTLLTTHFAMTSRGETFCCALLVTAQAVRERGADRVRSARRCRSPRSCPLPTSWRAGAKPSLGMLMLPGETALLSARDCFGGRLRDTPRNDVRGEVVVRKSGGGRVRSARRCRSPRSCPLPTSWRAEAKPSLGMLMPPGKPRSLPREIASAVAVATHLAMAWWGNGGGAGETALLAVRDCFGDRLRDSSRNDIQGRTLTSHASQRRQEEDVGATRLAMTGRRQDCGNRSNRR